MEFGLAVLKLSNHVLNASFNGGMIRAVARDKLQNNRGKCIGRKASVWDQHRRGIIKWFRSSALPA